MKIGFLLLFFLLNSFCMIMAAEQTRALWVTRWAYSSIADIEKIMDFASEHKFNAVLFQVRGNGTVTYPSAIELQSENFRTHAWDPLAEAVKRAHARNLQLHAWVNVFPGWSGEDPPQNDGQLFKMHPQWFMKDIYGITPELRNGYLFLSPTNPQVRDYLFALCQEIYTKYEIDGIHFDYIRFPASSYSYDDASVALFKQKFGASPQDKPAAWRLWRESSITDFVDKVYHDIKFAKPDVIVSAAIVGDRQRARDTYFQNGNDWLGRGIVDVIYPMLYINETRIFQQELEEFVLNAHNRHVYPGINVTNDNLAEKLKIVQNMDLPGVAIYSYDDLVKNSATDGSILNDAWLQKTTPAPLPWKLYTKDNVGPAFSQMQTIPSTLTAYTPFKIAVKITDPSGVYDSETDGDEQGIYVEYDTTWPSDVPIRQTLSHIPKTEDWYITDQEIPGLPAGAILNARIFAQDDFHEGLNRPKRNAGESNIHYFPVVQLNADFSYEDEIGPILWRPGALVVDAKHQIWVTTEKGGPIVVFDSTGHETAFSPIRFGMDGDYQSVTLDGVVGFANGSLNSMLIACNTNPPAIFRFNIETGQALPGFYLNFDIGEPDTIRAFCTDSTGNVYVLEHKSTRWFILSPTGEDLQNSPYGDQNTHASDIAVLKNGAMVFLVDRTADVVQCWHGATEAGSSQYWRAPDFLSDTRGFRKMFNDKNDHVYICNSQFGFIAEYDRTGNLLGHIVGENENMIAPLSMALSPDGNSMYIIEVVGEGPARVKVWRKK